MSLTGTLIAVGAGSLTRRVAFKAGASAGAAALAGSATTQALRKTGLSERAAEQLEEEIFGQTITAGDAPVNSGVFGDLF